MSILDLSVDPPVLWLGQSVHSVGAQEGLVRFCLCCGFLDGELVYGWKAVGMDIGLTGHAHVRLKLAESVDTNILAGLDFLVK